MAGLSPELRDTLALTLADGMTHKQAGEVLGVSEGTISWRMAEVKKHLRALHEQEQKA
jgi:RNA polymerase sigma-70 factor (ECF subfamily)